ncbi:MAG TPA: DNA-directed RNA polymerase subunit omega [Pyrinomonadaceae bacterium]|nr:DNA-directed RNA polymerase subunit omega [Pyrinomonadaceae bacterium]
MSKVKAEQAERNEQTAEQPEIDSKYRMIIVAAQRSKQLQRGARPRVDLDTQRHKPTRIALEEVQQGKVHFSLIHKEKESRDG